MSQFQLPPPHDLPKCLCAGGRDVRLWCNGAMVKWCHSHFTLPANESPVNWLLLSLSLFLFASHCPYHTQRWAHRKVLFLPSLIHTSDHCSCDTTDDDAFPHLSADVQLSLLTHRCLTQRVTAETVCWTLGVTCSSCINVFFEWNVRWYFTQKYDHRVRNWYCSLP